MILARDSDSGFTNTDSHFATYCRGEGFVLNIRNSVSITAEKILKNVELKTLHGIFVCAQQTRRNRDLFILNLTVHAIIRHSTGWETNRTSEFPTISRHTFLTQCTTLKFLICLISLCLSLISNKKCTLCRLLFFSSHIHNLFTVHSRSSLWSIFYLFCVDASLFFDSSLFVWFIDLSHFTVFSFLSAPFSYSAIVSHPNFFNFQNQTSNSTKRNSKFRYGFEP